LIFQSGNFVLNSGKISKFKIDCDYFDDLDRVCFAKMCINLVPIFSAVEGVPRGGILLANALNPFKSKDGPLLIVDDVYTTGNSMERHRKNRNAVGIVIFARNPITLPWVQCLFQATKGIFDA